MKSTKVIIDAIDNELLKTGKPFLSLQLANKLLVAQGLMSIKEKNDQNLKRIIEENKIPHAIQTTQKPKQWRIPLSIEGKKRQEAVQHEKIKKENQRKTRQALRNQHQFTTICPRCRTNLIVPQEIVSQYFIQCLNCGKEFKNPLVNQKSGKKKKEVPISQILIVSALVLFTVFIVAQSFKDDGPRRSNKQNWDDPGVYESGSSEWPYYGRTTKELLIDLRDTFEGRAVTPSTEQALYNKVGGMYPGPQKGPKYYSYDFLEVPISMTLINENGQRFYLMFQRGGVKKGDPRLKL